MSIFKRTDDGVGKIFHQLGNTALLIFGFVVVFFYTYTHGSKQSPSSHNVLGIDIAYAETAGDAGGCSSGGDCGSGGCSGDGSSGGASCGCSGSDGG